jgi:hypothetical protein
VAKLSNKALLLGHLSQQHHGQTGPYLERMHTEETETMAAQAFEVIEEEA